MAGDIAEPPEDFETWLRRRVAKAVEAGEVPASLLTELQAEIETARAIPQDVADAAAIRQIANLAGVPEDEATKTMAVVEAQPTVTRELLMRRFVKAWLAGQREAYQEQRRSA